jgi:hypothetical protein
MTDNEKQYLIECERSTGVIEQTVSTMHKFGGDIRIFSFTMLRTSLHLFAEVHGFAEVEKAIQHMLADEQKRRQPCGRA